MTVHLVNPSHLSFGVGVITPRWLFVLGAATPATYGRPRIVDETLEPLDLDTVRAGDIVGIGIHTGNALRGYEIGTAARARGATVVFGGIHATLYPDEADERGGAHTVVRGDGDVVWPLVIDQALQGTLQRRYDGGRVDADQFVPARWDLLPEGRYMWGSVQTVRGCPKHCSFCSVWRTDGQKPRQRGVDRVVGEIVELRRRGFRFVALADDNFYPVTLTDLAMAERQGNAARLEQLRSLRAERKDWAEVSFVSFELGTPPTWVAPGKEWNKIGYFRTFGGKLRYRAGEKIKEIAVSTIISWNGRWYVTHLSPIRH